MVAVCRATGDPRVVEAACGLADYLMSRPTIDGVFATWERSPLTHPYGPARLTARHASLVADPPAGVFVDCLHFDPPFLVALGVAVGRAEHIRVGVEQARGYVRLLQRADGLFDHFVLAGEAATYGPGWGRGQGWALLGLLEVLEILSDESASQLVAEGVTAEDVAELEAAVRRLLRAMVGTQRPDGHWHAVVTDVNSGDEHSTAAFMAAGLLRAARLGVGADPTLAFAAERALRAVVAATDLRGTLTGVSAAVMACTEPSHYANVPRGFCAPWGQGPLALALCEGRTR